MIGSHHCKKGSESKVDLLTAWPAMGAAAEMKQESRKSEQSFDQTLLEMGGVSAMTDQQLGAADGIAACAVSPPQQGGAKTGQLSELESC